MIRLFTAFFPLVLLMAACNDGTDHESVKPGLSDTLSHAPDTLIKGNFEAESGIKFDSAAITKFIADKPLFKEFSEDFSKFYRSKDYNYVWYNRKGLIEQAQMLVSTIENAQLEGVEIKIPYQDEYRRLVNHNDSSVVKQQLTPDINTELMLTAQYFNYAKNVWVGVGKTSDWYIPRRKLSYDTLLNENISKENFDIQQNDVVTPQYNGLKKALAVYRELEKRDTVTKVAMLSKPKTLRINDKSPVIVSIRRRLQELGVNPGNITDSIFDTELMNVVNQFRVTHGFKPDSTINNAVITALNVPVRKRIEQIMVNMERLRWVPSDRNSPEFIVVNIPEYRLHYYENGIDEWNCNVVVGTPMTKTVIFSGEIQYVVFSPYWYVPQSIINKEIKPGMKRNPNYLASHNMEWNGGKIRQKPGIRNSLGLVKFIFPNSNNIYLHDTPSKSLFNEDERAFSHGCVRVAKPRDLAIRLLRQDSTWTEKKIDAAMNAGVEKFVPLKKRIPVYIGYFTAFIDKDGNVNFRDDIYKRDDALFSMLVK